MEPTLPIFIMIRGWLHGTAHPHATFWAVELNANVTVTYGSVRNGVQYTLSAKVSPYGGPIS